MGNRASDDDQPDFSYDQDTNGLILRGYHLPEEIIGEILEKLPPENRLTCRLVCKRWDRIISYLSYDTYNRTFHTHHTSETLPFLFCYISLYNARLRKNLLKNVNGEDKFKNWEITRNGGDGWRIENPPCGSDALPEGVEEFNDHHSCFATSFQVASKEQCVDLTKDKHLSWVLEKFKPSIYVSEWVAARFDCGATYQMTLTMKRKGKEVFVKEVSHTIEQWLGSQWEKVILLLNYRLIFFFFR